MRTSTDALRSLKRYVATSLGSEWEVRIAADSDGADFHRPFARVRSTTPGTMMASGPTQAEYRQSYSILCYPALDRIPAAVAEERDPTADECRIEAARVEDLLFVALSVGTHAPSFGHQAVASLAPAPAVPPAVARAQTRYVRGHPRRIPLFNYDGIALDRPALETDRDKRDFMRVEGDPTIAILTDPNEPLSIVVAAELRMSWVRFAAVASTGMNVRRVNTRKTPGG